MTRMQGNGSSLAVYGVKEDVKQAIQAIRHGSSLANNCLIMCLN